MRFGTEEEQVLVMETAMKIRGWILGDGRSIRAVARETGISRTTIKKYLKKPEQPRYQRQQPRVGSKLNALTLKPDHPMGGRQMRLPGNRRNTRAGTGSRAQKHQNRLLLGPGPR